MLEKRILLRFGDLVLKGKNKPTFIRQLQKLLKAKMAGLNVEFDFQYDRIYLINHEENDVEVLKRLSYVSGIQSYCFIYKTTREIADIAKLAIQLINQEITLPTTFKIETKRADKRYPLTSQQITQAVAPLILNSVKDLGVDVKNPNEILNIELRNDGAYIYLKNHKAMGGFPVGIGGRGLVMLSGGIDSPVSAYLAIKQGIEVELLHFESTPLTPLESVQKVIDLAKIIARYMPKNYVKLHLVPFTNVHQQILAKVDDPYIITIMRRIMYRIAEGYANQNKLLCLINGESVGQVASQTLNSMKVVEAVTSLPILRPVITNDKQEIINLAKKIETFDISIRAFNDCCSIYVPKNPVTQPTIKAALFQEQKLDITNLVEQTISNIQTIGININSDLQIDLYGFDVAEALENYRKKDK